jgi:hypothetical protein
VRQRDLLNPVLASIAALFAAFFLNAGVAAAGCGSGVGGFEVAPSEVSASLAGVTPEAANAAPEIASSKRPQPGDVLIAGGVGSNGQTIGSAQFYSASLGSFVSTPAMGTARAAHAALMFPTQNLVLLVGGFTGKAKPTGSSIVVKFVTQATGRLYHIDRGTFGTFGPVKNKMKSGRSDDDRAFFPAVTLPSGPGFFPSGLCNGDIRPTAFDFDSGLNMFQFLPGPVVTTRVFHTATVLTNGKVLITGGMIDFPGDTTNTAEIFDPNAGTFTATTHTMNDSRAGQTATLLADGTVLIAGGATGAGGVFTSLQTAEIYNPATDTFTCAGGTKIAGGCNSSMVAARWQHTATLLADGTGRVLITGGFDGAANWTLAPYGKNNVGDSGSWTPTAGAIEDTAEVYDPVAKTFTAVVNPMTAARFGHTATLLTTGPNIGEVLIVGGFGGANPGAPLKSTELFNPASGGSFTAGPNLKAARAWHTATEIQ